MNRAIRVSMLATLACLGIARNAHASSLLVTGIFGGGVQAYDATTGASLGTFADPPVTPGWSDQVSGIVTTASGNVLVAKYGTTNEIYSYSSTGVPQGVLTSAQGTILNMSLGPDGLLYTFDVHADGEAVDVFNPTTGAFIKTAVETHQYYNSGFAIGANGNYLIQGFGQLDVFSGTTGAQMGAIYEGTVSGHLLTQGNDVYISSLGYGNDPNGIWKCAGCATGSGTSLQLATYTSGLGGMIFGPDGNLYAASGSSVLKFDPTNGAFLGVFGTAPATGGGYELAYTSGAPGGDAPEPATWLLAPGVLAVVVFVRNRRAGQVR